MADYQLTAWLLSDFDGPMASGRRSAPSMTADHALGSSSTLSPNANPISFFVTDDDPARDGTSEESGVSATLTQDLTIGTSTYPAGSRILSPYTLTTSDLPAINVAIGRICLGPGIFGKNLLVFAMTPLTPGQKLTFATSSGGYSDFQSSICFARGTMIDTPHGELLIETLQAGDEVMGVDGKIETILWAGRQKLSAFELMQNPDLCPVRIRRNALGPNLPSQDLLVSPQHRVLIDDWRAEYLFGEEQALIPAGAFLDNRTVVVDRLQTGTEYIHILLNSHNLLSANGLWAESLVPGVAAENALSHTARSEIAVLRPEFFEGSAVVCTDVQIAVAKPVQVLAA